MNVYYGQVVLLLCIYTVSCQPFIFNNPYLIHTGRKKILSFVVFTRTFLKFQRIFKCILGIPNKSLLNSRSDAWRPIDQVNLNSGFIYSNIHTNWRVYEPSLCLYNVLGLAFRRSLESRRFPNKFRSLCLKNKYLIFTQIFHLLCLTCEIFSYSLQFENKRKIFPEYKINFAGLTNKYEEICEIL